MLRVIPNAGAIRQEELWNAVLVQVALNRGIGGVAQALKDEGDLVLLDQAPNLRFSRNLRAAEAERCSATL
jgi:hypothetical protein